MVLKFLRRLTEGPSGARQRRLVQTRKALPKEEFVSRFAATNVSEEIAEETWRLVSDWCVEGFTPYPEDELDRIYGIGEEEVDEDIVLYLLNKFDCYIPTYDEMVSEDISIRTVADIVTFVDAMRKRKADRAGVGL